MAANVPFPLEHAWVVDTRDGKACEITWRKPGQEYWGVQFDRYWLAATLVRQSHYGAVEAFAAEAFRGDTYWRDGLDVSVPALYKGLENL